MNPVIKEALKEDIRYTVSMFVYIIVIAVILGSITQIGSRNGGAGSNDFFYTYITVFGIFITNAYCASKAKMDRYFSMGFSRNVFRKQSMLLGTVRSAILAVGFSLFNLLIGIFIGGGDVKGIVGANGQMSQEMALAFNIVLMFLFGWTVNNHMLADATMKKPRIAASVYLTSPSIWSFNNNKCAKNRSGNRVVYLLMIFIYAGAAIVLSFLLQWFFLWWLLAVIVIGLVVLNLVLLGIFSRKIKYIDIT